MARALKSGIIADLAPHAKTAQEPVAAPVPASLAAYVSLTRQLTSEFDQLQQRLVALADRWNV
jgi:hypothetical protein